MSNPFVNRIINYGTKAADQFQAHPLNWRTHPQKQRDAVQASLRELGWIGVVVENKRTGNLIDGHERVWQAMKNNESVPYIEVDLSEEEERLALAVFDPITYMAETDAGILDALLREVNTGEDALQELLASMADEAGLYQDKKDVDAPAQVDRAEELRQQWGVESGQLWQLGEHRLVCGDCTDATVVARLMGGERAQLLLTSPPYGVGMEYEGKPEQAHTVELVTACFGIGCQQVNADGFAFVNFGERYVWDVPMAQVYHSIFKDLGWRWYDQRFWKRSQVGMAIWNTTQPRAMSQVEYLFTFQNGKGAYPVHNMAISKEQLWEDDGSSAGMNHPAVMSLGVASKAVEIYTDANDMIFEPFSGSGTTIIACEQLGRKCRAVEISPGYVAVALQRWADATGKTPVLLTN